MATIVTRAGKGSPLTNNEVDANFNNLNTELGTKANTSSLATVATTGAYNDLTGKPTNVSSFTNDSGYITSSALSSYQPLDGDLTAIAALAGTTGFVKKTAANTYTLDTATYLTGITSGQVTTALGFTPYNSTNPAGYITSTASITGTAANVTGTVAIANGGTSSTTAAAALTALGAYPAANPSGYTSNTGTVTGVTGTAPIVSSGGTAPAISITAATVSVAGSMSAADKTKLDGIATGATANTGTVTSVAGTGTVSGLSLSGTVTTTGNLTLGGTLAVTSSNFASQTANTFLSAPNGTAGVPTFRAIVAADIPTLNQSTTGTASNVTGTVAIANGGTSSTTAAAALTALGAYPAANPSGYTSNVGTVTSVGGTGTVSGLTLSGTVTTSGNLTLGGTLSLTSGNVTTALGFTPYNSTNPAGYTSNTGTVTSVGGTGTVAGLTLGGSVTTSGNLSLTGTLSASIDNITDEHRLFNNMGDIHATRTGFDATGVASTVNFGWRFVQGNTNGPAVNAAAQYYSEFVGLGNDYASNTYGMQIAYPRNVSTPYIAIRYQEGGAFAAWQKISAGYADTAGSATTVSSITSGQVTTALGFTPYNATNPSGYITGISSTNVTTALGFTPYNATNPSGYITSSGSISGSSGSCTGNAATATSSTNALRIVFNDGPRDLSDRLPNTFARTVNWDFVGAGTGNGSGNYAGVMTFAPWLGTTASTGDSSYQLSFANQSGVNASGPARLSIRNGIDSTWNAWQIVLTSSNYNDYAPTKTGGGASGSWAINVTGSSGSCTGNAATVSSITSGQVTTALGYTPYNSSNPSGYTSNTGTVTDVTGTAPIVSSGGTTPAISMPAATASVNGYMTSTFAAKLNGIAAGATSNTGTVTSVGGTGTVSGLTLSGTVTGSGNLTLGGTLSLTSGNVTTALGYTPYNSSNPSGYTSNTGTVTSVSVTTANGVSGTVATSTTTPAITITLGAITPTSVVASGDITAFSDRRIKANIETIPSALDKLDHIRGVTYTRTDLEDKERRYAGVIAQEVEAVLPEAVRDHDGTKAVDYNATIALLIQAVKELRDEVEMLRK